MEAVKYQPLLEKTKLTKTDITALIRKLKVTVIQEQEDKKERQQMRMLIDSLQSFKRKGNQATPKEEAQKPIPKEEEAKTPTAD